MKRREIIGAWNAQADEMNKWHYLGEDEKLEWAMKLEREANSKARAGKPRQLPPVGMGMLHGEQQHCFEKGWKEGAAAVRAAIRARGNT